MFTDIIVIIVALLITYTYLIFLLFKKESFRKMIILSFSIILFFTIIFNSLINISGYPSSSELPKKFNLLYVKIINDDILLLLDDIRSNSYPRLYILNHSQSLEDELKKASLDLKNGNNAIGEIDRKISNNDYGITFRKVKKNIPVK